MTTGFALVHLIFYLLSTCGFDISPFVLSAFCWRPFIFALCHTHSNPGIWCSQSYSPRDGERLQLLENEDSLQRIRRQTYWVDHPTLRLLYAIGSMLVSHIYLVRIMEIHDQATIAIGRAKVHLYGQ